MYVRCGRNTRAGKITFRYVTIVILEEVDQDTIVSKSKKRNSRGKYRSATATIEGVALNTCLWNDSNLLGGVSADLGTENTPVMRRMGRHKRPISCPHMMSFRDKHLRGVDVHDQLRACK